MYVVCTKYNMLKAYVLYVRAVSITTDKKEIEERIARKKERKG